MLSASKVPTPKNQILNGSDRLANKSRAGDKKGQPTDLWQENIHFAKEHDDPEDAVRLVNNLKLVNDHDKFVEYIRHVESKLLIPAVSLQREYL